MSYFEDGRDVGSDRHYPRVEGDIKNTGQRVRVMTKQDVCRLRTSPSDPPPSGRWRTVGSFERIHVRPYPRLTRYFLGENEGRDRSPVHGDENLRTGEGQGTILRDQRPKSDSRSLYRFESEVRVVSLTVGRNGGGRHVTGPTSCNPRI